MEAMDDPQFEVPAAKAKQEIELRLAAVEMATTILARVVRESSPDAQRRITLGLQGEMLPGLFSPIVKAKAAKLLQG